MLRGGIFSKTTSYAGIIGGSFLAIFTIWATFIPTLFEAAMIVAMLGGLASMVWYVLTARRLFQLGKVSQ
jgi:dipeptide/tripeptide permease